MTTIKAAGTSINPSLGLELQRRDHIIYKECRVGKVWKEEDLSDKGGGKGIIIFQPSVQRKLAKKGQQIILIYCTQIELRT